MADEEPMNVDEPQEEAPVEEPAAELPIDEDTALRKVCPCSPPNQSHL
jgi:hypothetical protein